MDYGNPPTFAVWKTCLNRIREKVTFAAWKICLNGIREKVRLAIYSTSLGLASLLPFLYQQNSHNTVFDFSWSFNEFLLPFAQSMSRPK